MRSAADAFFNINMAQPPDFSLKLSRFGNTSDAEKQRIMDERNAKNTNRATKSCMATFTDYLVEKNLPSIDQISTESLPEIMKDFYTNAKKIDGGDYKVQSLKCLRAGINRYMKAERGIDIIDNENFVSANQMFRGVNKQKRIQGKGSTKTTPVISDEDLREIYSYFRHDIMNKPDPRKIQQCLIFFIIYYFCRRGRENLYTMTVDTFKVDIDPTTGRRFVYQDIDEHDKNHGVDSTDPANQARMYEIEGS